MEVDGRFCGEGGMFIVTTHSTDQVSQWRGVSGWVYVIITSLPNKKLFQIILQSHQMFSVLHVPQYEQ